MRFIQTISAGKRGGIQQVSESYAKGFASIDVPLLTVANLPDDLTENYNTGRAVLLKDRGIASPWRTLDLIKTLKYMHRDDFIGSSAAIVHNGNSIRFVRNCLPKGVPVISVCHMEKLGRRLAADIILCLTEKQRSQALKELGHRAAKKSIVALGNPLTLDPIALPKELAWRRMRGKRLVVGTLSNLEDRKGLDVLIRALPLVRRVGIDMTIRFGGRGSKEDELRSQAAEMGVAEHVEFAGWISDRHSYFSGLDLYCMPSRIEPFGLALIEAMSRALPVCASDTEGPSEILRSGTVGWLFRSGDHQDLARSLIEMATNPAASRSAAVAAADHVNDQYGAAAIARRICQAVEEHNEMIRIFESNRKF